ncbi:hypothetical protein XENOCAPTIV_021614 [Xenoophorus captivus]|uniref:Uncharacterized protein n=1 Tax=Xenoophorus captivus TaxID=1517983 RepID=A0ABV0R4D3_9TELE
MFFVLQTDLRSHFCYIASIFTLNAAALYKCLEKHHRQGQTDRLEKSVWIKGTLWFNIPLYLCHVFYSFVWKQSGIAADEDKLQTNVHLILEHSRKEDFGGESSLLMN